MRISIIGCGWLGLPLGQHLAQRGHEVLVSTTRKEKLESLSQAGIKGYLLKLNPMPIGESFNELFDTDLLIINIPPGRRTQSPEFYEEQVKYLAYLANQHKVPRIIFVSSTSYYPNTKDWVDPQTLPDLDNGSSKAVVQGEKQIKKVDAKLLITRIGGLMGAGRIPGRWFAGKPTKGAQTPVNYIHQADLIDVITSLAEQAEWEKDVMNLVCPEHPLRQEVHEAMAKKYGFEPPQWQSPEVIPHKLVKSDIAHFDLTYPNPKEF